MAPHAVRGSSGRSEWHHTPSEDTRGDLLAMAVGGEATEQRAMQWEAGTRCKWEGQVGQVQVLSKGSVWERCRIGQCVGAL
jgi:hypothetical protein